MTRMLTFIALLFATPAWAEIVLYCQDELATGIIKEMVAGRHVLFNLSDILSNLMKNMTLVGVSSYTPKALNAASRLNMLSQIIFFAFGKRGNMNYLILIKRASGTRFMISTEAWIGDQFDTSVMRHGTCQKF